MSAGIVFSCSYSGKANHKTDKASRGSIVFSTILEGQHSLADTASAYLIDDGKQWAEIWRFANGKIEPMPAVPEIDFEQDMVLAVFMGRKNSGGYRNEISRMNLKNGDLHVEVNNYRRAGGMMLPVLTSPFYIVKMPQGEYKLKIIYEDIDE